MATTPKSAKTAASDSAGAHETKRSLEDEIAVLRADLAKLAEQLSKAGQASYDTARRAAKQGAEQLKTHGEVALGDFKESAENIEAQLSQAVREKPVTSLAIAASVGFLFALLARR